MPLATPAPACATCLQAPPAFDATHAVWTYGFPLDHLITRIKFGHHAFKALACVRFLADGLLDAPRPAADLILPVPLSRARLRERGFNQALELARPLARAWQLPLDTRSLVRSRETPPQSRLPWHARKRNVRHAFESLGDYSGRTVIVVDDVMTTGATLDAVARVLKDHGATRVINWVAARTVRRST